MKINNEKTLGTKRSEYYYANGQRAHYEDVVEASFTTGAASSPNIHGDFKSPNNWGYWVTKNQYQSGMIRYVDPGRTRIDTGILASGSSINNSLIETVKTKAMEQAYDLCLNSFYSKLSGKVDVGSNAAEGGYKSGCQQTIQAADDARRQAGRWGVSSIGKAWLSMQYMWLPAVQDIYNLSLAAAGQLTRNGFYISASATSQQGFPKIDIDSGGYVYNNVTVGGQLEYAVKMGGLFKVNPYFDLLARLTSLDPLVLLWNRLPYSFVVDWFYNVGGYLGQLESAARYRSAYVSNGGYITHSWLSEAHISHYGAASGQSGITGQISSSRKDWGMQRTVQGSIPLPHQPSLKMDLGSGTLLNAAALLASKLKPGFLKEHGPDWDKSRWKRFS